jgi:hypothetical protein
MRFGNAQGKRFPTGLLPAAGLLLALSGCFSTPDIDSPAASVAQPGPATPRAAAIAEIRAEAAAGENMPYPDVFRAEQTTRLSSREEPLSVGDVDAIQAELALIARARATTTDARQIAALEARARELRRLMLTARPEPMRQ